MNQDMGNPPFQFLIGAMTGARKWFMPGSGFVSIPYRRNDSFPESFGNIFVFHVSIPYRRNDRQNQYRRWRPGMDVSIPYRRNDSRSAPAEGT